MSEVSNLTSGGRVSGKSVFSDPEIREIAARDSRKIARWARDVAQEHGIRLSPRPNDLFVKAVSRLSDGVVDLDPVEELLVALGRAGVISAYQRGLLQVQYLR